MVHIYGTKLMYSSPKVSASCCVRLSFRRSKESAFCSKCLSTAALPPFDSSASALGRCQQSRKLQNPDMKCFIIRDDRLDVAFGVTLVELYRCNHGKGNDDRHESVVMSFR